MQSGVANAAAWDAAPLRAQSPCLDIGACRSNCKGSSGQHSRSAIRTEGLRSPQRDPLQMHTQVGGIMLKSGHCLSEKVDLAIR